MAAIKFRDLDTLRAQYTSAKGTKKLDSYCLMASIPSDETVYRVHQAEERDKLRVEAPTCPKRRGQQLEGRGAWRDFKIRAEAEAHVLEGGSLLIEGIAGTGKSTFARGVVERLKSMGKKVAIISKTHVASSRIDGSTADVWVRRFILGGSPNIDCLWIDECGQLEITLWAQIGNYSLCPSPSSSS